MSACWKIYYSNNLISEQLKRGVYNRFSTIGSIIGTNKLWATSSRFVVALLQGPPPQISQGWESKIFISKLSFLWYLINGLSLSNSSLSYHVPLIYSSELKINIFFCSIFDLLMVFYVFVSKF